MPYEIRSGKLRSVSERPCDPAELADVENRLGVRLPVALRSLYANGNGRFDELGQWWVVWPIDRVVESNETYWREGWLDRSLVSFGDDGTGDPFCVRVDGSSEAVARWSMIERQPYEQYESMAAFTTEWLAPA